MDTNNGTGSTGQRRSASDASWALYWVGMTVLVLAGYVVALMVGFGLGAGPGGETRWAASLPMGGWVTGIAIGVIGGIVAWRTRWSPIYAVGCAVAVFVVAIGVAIVAAPLSA